MRPTPVEIVRIALGTPSDWNIRRPRFIPPRPGLQWAGLVLIAASLAVSWFAFAQASGDGGNVRLGLFVGAVAILLMAWSFVLAVRLPFLEPLFGGLDRMYRVHRWSGTLSVVAMFLHTSIEPEIEGGIRGASRSVANTAEDLAGTGETMLYVLVALSLLRWFPYRWWRWTHKLLGVPFAFACWHFFTAEKPYANGSAWGWWFGAFMVAGLIAYVARVLVRDSGVAGRRYRVSEVHRRGPTTEVVLVPRGRPLEYRAGQFAVIKLQTKGLSEPHVFTIASGPASRGLRFYIRDLGDWTAKIQAADLVGSDAVIEGPYGDFEPLTDNGRPICWIAGGVGITPFLAAIDTLVAAPIEERPLLVYCVRDRQDATAIEALEQADLEGRIRLEVFASGEGRRFSPSALADLAPEGSLNGTHVAVCGPTGLVASAAAAARRLGADHVETEQFDIRGGFGPDLSKTIAALVSTAQPGVDSPD